MSGGSRLGRQLEQVVGAFTAAGTSYALIGGLALAPHGVVRATQDIDLLIDSSQADSADRVLIRLGYQCIFRSGDAANYQRDDERVDLLYAQRPIARRLLAEAASRPTPFGTLRVVGLEGLIGFKVQGLVNDPRRTQDLEDIRALLRANRASIDIGKVRDYFRLFDRDELLDELLETLP